MSIVCLKMMQRHSFNYKRLFLISYDNIFLIDRIKYHKINQVLAQPNLKYQLQIKKYVWERRDVIIKKA
jgi:hypothetical protein